MMNIAYLISAYKDPAHLRRLCDALKYGVENDVHFFVHIDKKVDIRPFERFLQVPNVHFTDHRFWSQWGGKPSEVPKRVVA